MDVVVVVLCFNDTATTEIYTYGHTLSLHDSLPISGPRRSALGRDRGSLGKPVAPKCAPTDATHHGKLAAGAAPARVGGPRWRLISSRSDFAAVAAASAYSSQPVASRIPRAETTSRPAHSATNPSPTTHHTPPDSP